MRWNRETAKWSARSAALVLMLSALLVVASPTGALAAGSDTLSLAITNGRTFPYDGVPAPRFIMTLVVAAPFTDNGSVRPILTMDSGETFYGVETSVSPDKLTYVYDVDTYGYPITGGNRTATATFTNPNTGDNSTSNSVNFSVSQMTLPSFSCSVQNLSGLASPGQSLTFNMAVTPPATAPGDWQSSTYTIQFTGPTTLTYPNLRLDSNGDVTVNAPTQIGAYGEPKCFFNGTNDFAQAEAASYGLVTVSEKHALGSVQFYTNPTTPATAKPVSVYVVFHPAPGLPTPTGYVSFTLTGVVGDSTNSLPLNSDGTLLVNLGAIPVELNSGSSWSVNYDGDPYYNIASVSFPLTNPPIPGGSGGNGGGTGGFGNPQATPSGTPHATTTATAVSHVATPALPTPGPVSSHAVIGQSSGATPVLLLSGALGVLVVLGGAVSFFVWSRRRRLALANAANVGPPFTSASPPPGLSPYDAPTIADDATFPYRDE